VPHAQPIPRTCILLQSWISWITQIMTLLIIKYCPAYYRLALYPKQSYHYVYELHHCHVLHLMCDTRFYNHRKQQDNLWLLYFNHPILQ
jgi:hypothetical protein